MIKLIKSIFGFSEERKKQQREDEARWLIRVKDIDGIPYICYDGTPILVIGEEGSLDTMTIPVKDVSKYLTKIRNNYINTHYVV